MTESAPTAAERVRQRIKTWVATNGRGSQRRLAQSVPGKFGYSKTDSWISDILNGRAEVQLEDLDAIAEGMGMRPGDLVAAAHSTYLEILPSEYAVISHLRKLPQAIRRDWLSFLNYVFGADVQDFRRSLHGLSSPVTHGTSNAEVGSQSTHPAKTENSHAAESASVSVLRRVEDVINDLLQLQSALTGGQVPGTGPNRSGSHAAGRKAHRPAAAAGARGRRR